MTITEDGFLVLTGEITPEIFDEQLPPEYQLELDIDLSTEELEEVCF